MDERARKLLSESTSMKLSRRSIIQRASAMGLSAAVAGSILTASGKERPLNHQPYMLQSTGKLNILSSTAFVPAAQTFFQKQAEDFGTQNKVEVTTDFINWPDLQPRTTAAVQAGAGPDIVEMWDTIPYLFKDNLVDCSDIVQPLEKIQGGYFDWVTNTAAVDGTWMSVPHGTSSIAVAYRKSYLEKAGVADPEKNFPKTWDELYTVGKALKEMGKPIGQALGQTLGDAPGFCYPLMWGYGSMEVEDDGKTVAFETDGFKEGLSNFVQGWKDGFDEGGLGWDDSANNTAYLADQISMTLNGSSIYLAASDKEGENYNAQIAEDTYHAPLPSGPEGQFAVLGSRSMGVLKYSENQDVAKEFLSWWFSEEQYTAWLDSFKGYIVPPGPAFIGRPVFTEDPKLKPFVDIVKIGRNKGYAGPANQKAAQAAAQYVVVNAFAGAVQNGDVDSAISEGARMLERIYSR